MTNHQAEWTQLRLSIYQSFATTSMEPENKILTFSLTNPGFSGRHVGGIIVIKTLSKARLNSDENKFLVLPWNDGIKKMFHYTSGYCFRNTTVQSRDAFAIPGHIGDGVTYDSYIYYLNIE